ncbi:MAG: transcription antitermination factor NusB [Ruminococcus sp.]|nr:transcription antitermination factor NusB [Ruminococcus sp.]
MAARREIRRSAFLLCFEKLFHDEGLEELFESAQILDDIIPVDEEVKALVRGVTDKQEELDAIIARYSDKRAVSRIPRINLAVLRLAIYEALYDDKVPVNVAISEAVYLTETYAFDADVSFVNGVLGSFAKSLDKEEK